jgi:hypothetical protein
MRLPRRLAFSLRTLLVLVTLVGALCGWLGGQWRIVLERRAALDAWGSSAIIVVKGAGGQEYEFGTGPEPAPGINGRPLGRRPPREFGGLHSPTVPWVRRLLGDMAVRQIWIPETATDVAAAVRVFRLFPESTMSDFRPGAPFLPPPSAR